MVQTPVLLKYSLIILCIFCMYGNSIALQKLPEEMHNGILLVTEYVYRDDLPAAESEAKKLIRRFPDHPVGYFCMAFVADSWMARFQANDKEDVFYRYCDLAIEKGEKLLSNGKQVEWAKFFMGGADGYKGTYEFRYERWITAFRYGWKGVSVLLELEKAGCGIQDVYYGIGSYNYWRSALIKLLWWMPGIEDKRQLGIEQLFKARRESIYSKTWASIALVDILLNENRYEETLKITEEELERYPKNIFFLWGKARALAGLHQHEEAITLLRQLIAATENDEYDNHYNTTLYRLQCARILFEEKKYIQVIAECNIINSFLLHPTVKKRLEGLLNEVKNLSKQSLQQMFKEKIE